MAKCSIVPIKKSLEFDVNRYVATEIVPAELFLTGQIELSARFFPVCVPFRVMVNPPLAKMLLEKNCPNNRGRTHKHIDQLAMLMLNGLWVEKGDPFIFATDGRGLSFQHRCKAIVKSGTTQVVVCFIVVPTPELLRALDSNVRVRTKSVNLKVSEPKFADFHEQVEGPTLTKIIKNGFGRIGAINEISSGIFGEVAKKYNQIRKAIAKVSPPKRTDVCGKAYVRAAIFMAMNQAKKDVERERILEFSRYLSTGLTEILNIKVVGEGYLNSLEKLRKDILSTTTKEQKEKLESVVHEYIYSYVYRIFPEPGFYFNPGIEDIVKKYKGE